MLEHMTVEVIADGCHLPAELLRMVWKAKGADKICLVCDSMRHAGLELDNTRASGLGRKGEGSDVWIEDGVAKQLDRSAFAGSIAADDRMVRVMYRDAGIPLTDCIAMMCTTPAAVMGFQNKGVIAPGKDADLVLFDENINIQRVYVNGKSCIPADDFSAAGADLLTV